MRGDGEGRGCVCAEELGSERRRESCGKGKSRYDRYEVGDGEETPVICSLSSIQEANLSFVAQKGYL
jgi:hypothetical protein